MQRRDLVEEKLTHSVIGAFYEVYNTLGFGFLEHVYRGALEMELRARGHQVGREVGVVVLYKGVEVAVQRIDILVDEKLIVEVKSTLDLHAAAQRQLYSYLRATRLQVGLLLHFGFEPRFYRAVELHTRQTPQMKSCTDATDETDATDRSSVRTTRCPTSRDDDFVERAQKS